MHAAEKFDTAGPHFGVVQKSRPTAPSPALPGRTQPGYSGGVLSPLPNKVSDVFDPRKWRSVDGFPDADVTYHRGVERTFAEDGTVLTERDLPVVRIAFNRPEVLNAFRPETVDQLYRAIDHAHLTMEIGTVILTGNGPSPRDPTQWAFSSGGDQAVRGADGYRYGGSSDKAENKRTRDSVNPAVPGRMHILEVQRLMRTSSMIFIAVIPGWCVGGGHSLNVVADLSIASREHARFQQLDANVGSFDAGYGTALLAKQTGDKRAREIFFLGQEYNAEQAERWGVVNAAVTHMEIENKALEWARIMATRSPQALRMMKFSFNMAQDGLAGQQVFAGEATRMAYSTAEGREARDAFLEKRHPDFRDFPHYA